MFCYDLVAMDERIFYFSVCSFVFDDLFYIETYTIRQFTEQGDEQSEITQRDKEEFYQGAVSSDLRTDNTVCETVSVR